MNNKLTLALTFLAFFSIASATRLESISNLWGAWKTAHNKQYSTSEETHRFSIFLHNIQRIAKLNTQNSDTKFAINKFADLTASEFKSKFSNRAQYQPKESLEFLEYPLASSLPSSIDWRNKGAVTPVPDQGNCGSCWTFSATGALEGLHFINTGKLISFSKQQLIDCASDAGQGCGGGWPRLAFDYTAQYGLETEADYPYVANDQKCNYDASKAIKINSGRQEITPKSSDQLKAALVNGPVSVMIESTDDVFQFYKSGVISAGCRAGLNHAVLVVGYQKVGVLEAFIVKNSWGTDWGMSGYVYISTIQQINEGYGACGILGYPVIPTN